jgi:DNA-binding transcriptional MerR regulator
MDAGDADVSPMSSPTPENVSSTESHLIRPADAARQLGIPASTLRRWSRRFASFLSPEANGAARENGSRGHRRYTPDDLAVLARCKELLSAGRTFEQVTAMLEQDFQSEAPVVEGEIELDENKPTASEADAEEPLQMMQGEDATDAGNILAQALASIPGFQQAIITGQQSERELLGVVLQDNFTLKEENKKLRERMVETERRIFEMKREMEKARTEERERMRQMEAYLFQLQRQMDDLVRRQSVQAPAPGYPAVLPQPVAPTPAPVVSPQPVRRAAPQPSPTSPSEPEPSTMMQGAPPAEAASLSPRSEPAPKKRSFWDWLLGR